MKKIREPPDKCAFTKQLAPKATPSFINIKSSHHELRLHGIVDFSHSSIGAAPDPSTVDTVLLQSDNCKFKLIPILVTVFSFLLERTHSLIVVSLVTLEFDAT